MSREFEIRRQGDVSATPEEYWDAITTGIGGWLWPMEFEPRVGGAAAFGGTVTRWDPPRHLVTRVDGDNGWFNQLEHVIEGRNGTTTWRYVHSGIIVDDWDNQYDGANQHTDFYLHTLEQYLLHFSRRPVSYVSFDAPPAATAPNAFTVLRGALGIGADATQGSAVRLDLPGLEPLDAVLDYLHPNFIGLRTDDAMYRFFGRNAFGAPVGFAVHHFAADADPARIEKQWGNWLTGVYA